MHETFEQSMIDFLNNPTGLSRQERATQDKTSNHNDTYQAHGEHSESGAAAH